jgi:hypothetical protein
LCKSRASSALQGICPSVRKYGHNPQPGVDSCQNSGGG